MKYVAAPRGVNWNYFEDELLSGDRFEAVYADGTRLEVHDNFREAWDDALEMSEQDLRAYEVIMINSEREIISDSRLIASFGVAYEPVDDDELDARIEEETADYD